MRPALTPETGFILFSGPDAWSPLRSLGWYAAARPEGVACLFATDDIAGSKQAADTLRRVASKRWPRLRVIVPGEASANTAEAFARRFADWKTFHPELKAWVIDATAATLPVRVAMANAVLGEPAVTLISRERDGSWSQLVRDPASGKPVAGSIEPPPADVLDGGPLTDLLEAFCHGVAEVRWRESRAPLALTVDEVARMVAAGVPTNWNWREMVAAGTGAPCREPDYDLRDFLATTLHALGVPHVRLNVHLAWTSLREDPLRLDVALCRNGRLYVFDCQTAEETTLSPQAADRVRAIFSQMDVTGIVLRPNRWTTSAERTLSSLTPSACLLDADACRQLFSRLGDLLDIPVPQALREAERTALRFGGRRLPVLSAASDAQRVGAAMKVDERIYDVWRGSHVDDPSTDWPWRAARVAADRWFLQGRIMQGGSADELRRRLAARFTAERVPAEIRFFEVSGNQRYWHAVLAAPRDPQLLTRWLRKWEKVPLII